MSMLIMVAMLQASLLMLHLQIVSSTLRTLVQRVQLRLIVHHLPLVLQSLWMVALLLLMARWYMSLLGMEQRAQQLQLS